MARHDQILNIIVTYDCLPKVGGAHMWLYEVYRRWHSDSILLTQTHARASHDEQTEREFDALDHGPLRITRTVEPLHDIDLFSFKCLKTFYQHVRSIRACGRGSSVLVHSVRSFPEGFAALLYKRLHPRTTRLVTYAHGEELLVARSSGQLRLMAKWTYEASDLVIANSENTRKMVAALAPRARIVCIHPGVDVAAFARPASEVQGYRQRLGWPDETTIVATVARMEMRKNQQAVIRAIADLRRSGLPVAYLCAGDGPERDRLEALAADLGVQQWVRFPGIVNDREKELIYGACDIYAMPSIQVGEMIEGFGIVFLEAGAAGKPVISGNIGGQPEAVHDGKTGYVIDGNNGAQLQMALQELASNSDLRRRLGNAGCAWAREHDWTNVVSRTREEIERVLGQT